MFSKNPIGWVLFGLMGAAMCASIVLNFLLFGKAKQYYTEVNAIRLDPAGLGYFSTTPIAKPSDERIRVVVFGDSRASDWEIPIIEGYEFINRGVPSQTTVQTLQRFEAHIDPLRPDIVLLQVGINDLKTIGLFPEHADEITQTTTANMVRLVERAEALGAAVVLSSILPTGDVPLARRPFWSPDIELATREVNSTLRDLADHRESIYFFDAAAVVTDEHGQMSAAYQVDELHLTADGYTALNRALVPWLQSLAVSR